MYDAAAKAELVALCRQPGASVSRLARECGINANQVSRWLREHDRAHARKAVAVATTSPSVFVQLLLPPAIAQPSEQSVAATDVQVRLPNGVAIELRGVHLHNVSEVIQVLGRLQCCASTSN